jgi:hypothetical protein
MGPRWGALLAPLAPLAPLALLALLSLPIATLRAQERYEVAVEGARLRSGPSTRAKILRTMPRGTEVLLLKDSSGWAHVRVESVTGYVRRTLIAASGRAPQPHAPVAAPPPATAAEPHAPSSAGDGGRPAHEGTSVPVSGRLVPAEAAGVRAGESKSVLPVGVAAGLSSLVVPGSGFLGLLFLHRAGPAAVPRAAAAHRTELQGHSPEYVHAWAQAYDRTLTTRRKHAVLLGATVGSVAGIVAYKLLVFKSSAPSASTTSTPPPPGPPGPKANRFTIVVRVP